MPKVDLELEVRKVAMEVRGALIGQEMVKPAVKVVCRPGIHPNILTTE